MKYLTLIGMFLTSSGAMWLAWIQIYDRVKKRDKYYKLGNLQQGLKVFSKIHRDSVESIEDINERFGYEAYDLEKETAKTRIRLAELKSSLKELEKPDHELGQIMKQGANQLWAFLILAIGFLLQLIAKLVLLF